MSRRRGMGWLHDAEPVDGFSRFRDDGWPICPQCDEDELYSGFEPEPPSYTGTLTEYLSAGLRCYRCNWSRPAQKVTR